MANRRRPLSLFRFFFGQTTSGRARRDQYRLSTIGKNPDHLNLQSALTGRACICLPNGSASLPVYRSTPR